MSAPDGGTSGAQPSKHHNQSQDSLEPDPQLAVKYAEETGVQLESSLGKSAECTVYPLTADYTVIADFQNWDPDQDVKAVEFERCLQEKCGKDSFHGFWWKKFPPDTRFRFDVPYPVMDRMTDMYKLISDAIYEYSGDAKIRTTVYHA